MYNVNSMVGLSPELRAVLADSGMSGLPVIRGKWFIVDPYKLTVADGGIEGSFDSIEHAYDACTSGYGDGILVMSGGTGTSSQTSSYLQRPLVWSKHGITVIGVGAPTRIAQRARIANKNVTTGASTVLSFLRGASPVKDTINRTSGSFITDGFAVGDILRVATTGTGANGTSFVIGAVSALTITLTSSDTLVTETAVAAGSSVVDTYNTELLSVTGSNNAFYNLHLSHTGDDALELSCLKVTGERNYFGNVHAGIGVANAATALTRSLWMYAAAENTFEGCTFGLDSVDRGNNATYDILIQGACTRNRFKDCETIRHTSAGVACYAVYFNTTTGGRPTVFDNCRFTCWSTAGGNANQTVCMAGTGSNDDVWLTGNSCHPGYAALGLSGVAWIQGANIASGVAGLLTTT